MQTSELTQIILALVPIIVTGIVTVVTNKQVQDLKTQQAINMTRIARLEQILIDHDIPIPGVIEHTGK